MDTPEAGLESLRADIARRLAGVLRDWPPSEAAPLVERMARIELKYRELAALERQARALEEGCPEGVARPEREHRESRRMEAGRLPSVPAQPTPRMSTRTRGDPQPMLGGATIRLPHWLGHAEWPLKDFGLPGYTAPSGVAPMHDAQRVGYVLCSVVEETRGVERVGGRELRVHACRFAEDYYPYEGIDTYGVQVKWALGPDTWLELAGGSYTRRGQEVLLRVLRTLRPERARVEAPVHRGSDVAE